MLNATVLIRMLLYKIYKIHFQYILYKYNNLGTLADNHKDFFRILKSAFNRANDCSSDPICFHSDGQGVGGLNLAACYSCALLPENACEEFNSFLDRAVLIHEDYGFINN
jgi:hypothetical protein